jgi:hypothetical protein
MMNENSKQRKKKCPTAGEPYPVTRAVTHIRLLEVNPGKLAALDMLAPIFLILCQQYVTLCAQRGATLSVVREHDLTQAM